MVTWRMVDKKGEIEPGEEKSWRRCSLYTEKFKWEDN
jgi:hypothetical protein